MTVHDNKVIYIIKSCGSWYDEKDFILCLTIIPCLSYSGEVGNFICGAVGGKVGDKLEDYGKEQPSKPIVECDNPYPYTATCEHEKVD